MEEKENYVIYTDEFGAEKERVVKMTCEQARAIEWFMECYDIDGGVELAEKYEGAEI